MMFKLFTIGYSTHSTEYFIELLKKHGITAVCDVRSSPYSRFMPQFNRELLKNELANYHIAYIYLGAELGPRSSDSSCYENGKVQYNRVSITDIFQQGLRRLRKGMASYRIALMCAEKDPITCHRMILICRNLRNDDIVIRHILEDGNLEDQINAERRLMKLLKVDPVDLFASEAEQIQLAYDLQSEKIAYRKDVEDNE
ncbi:MAG: DUF488 domain-containing protein [Smithella sp.]